MAYVARSSLTLQVPATVAFDRLAAHDTWSRWMPASFRPVGPPLGRLTEGARFRVKILGLPGPVTCKVTVARSGSELTWCGGAGRALQAEHRFLFEPRGASAVLVESVETWRGPVATLLRPLILPGATKVGRDQLAALANALAS